MSRRRGSGRARSVCPSRLGGLLCASLAAGACSSGSSSVHSTIQTPLLSLQGPSSWSISGPQGGPYSNTNAVFVLENVGETPVQWTASSVPSFVQLDLLGGSIAPSGQTDVHADLLEQVANDLGPSFNTGTLAFHNESGPQPDQMIPCSLLVDAPVISSELTPASDFTTSGAAGGPFQPPSIHYTLHNSGTVSLGWLAIVGDPWVTVTPDSGQLAAGAAVDLYVAIDDAATGSLPGGQHSSFVHIVNAATSTTLHSRNVALTLTGPTTKDGWTVFTPSQDTRKVYVSSSRGSDSNDGLSPGAAKRTIASGKLLLRTGYPDWLLLKCGDTWDENLGEWHGISGRSITERMLIGSYGTGERPLLRTGTSAAVTLFGGGPANYLAVVGLHFWANNYNGSNGTPNAIAWYGASDSLLVEDCRMDAYFHAAVIQADSGQLHANVRVRRNVMADSYSTTAAFAAGLYTENCAGLLVEENIFDRNGWNDSIPDSVPSWFLHNVYVHNNNTGVVVRGNLVAGTDGVQVRPGGTVEDNLFLRNAVSLVFGGGTYPNLAGVSGVVRNNVMLDGGDFGTNGPSQGPRGWGLSISNITSATVENNIVCNNVNGHGPRVFSLEYANGFQNNTRGVEHTRIENNIVYNWGGSVEFHGSAAQTVAITLRNNFIQNSVSPAHLIVHETLASTSGVTSAQNVLYNSQAPDTAWIRVGSSSLTLLTWMPMVHDVSSIARQERWPHPERTIATYHVSIGGAPTFEAFMSEARKQSKQHWHTQYTADAVNRYIREGFGR